MTDEEAATEISKQVLIESIPHIGEVAALAVATRIVSALVEVEIIETES